MTVPPARDITDEERNRFREARVLIRNEFCGLNEHQQYMNAFSRLLKWDPLQRVSMLGTDQRDTFVPVIRSGIATGLSDAGFVLDIGCGDGQTFNLIADTIPVGSTINAIEPNAEFLKSFDARLDDHPTLRKGTLQCAPFEPELLKAGALGQSTYDLILATHVLYFFADLEASLLSIYSALSPGGAAFIVFADELTAYTGQSVRSYLRAVGDTEAAEEHAESCRHRLGLFAQDQGEAGTLMQLVHRTLDDATLRIEIHRQETRLYGHSFADIIALSNITGLEAYASVDKFDAGADLIERFPRSVDFRVESEPGSARFGMLSVSQPQIVAIIRKTARARDLETSPRLRA